MSYSSYTHPTLTVLAFIALLLSAGCDSAAKTTVHEGASATSDPRTPVELPAEAQQAVLHEMRQMLGAMGGAMSAAVLEDTTAVIAALAPAGSAAAADPAIEELLPPEWKELAERTHGGFDSLTAAVRATRTGRALKDTALTGIARISASCASCHETFRVMVR